MIHTLFLLLLGACLFPACTPKKTHFSELRAHSLPLFISPPVSIHAFENISPLVYDVVTTHFTRVGYHIVTKPTQGYTLKITIKNIDPAYKYVSPDIVLFHTKITMTLACSLINYQKTVVATKEFTNTLLVTKPQNPSLQSDFQHFAYTKILEKMAPRIEQYMRPWLTQRKQP